MQQAGIAPAGALCAIHAGRSAALVCSRCGSFMCDECSEGGAQVQCPKCRELTGGSAFPLRRDDFDFSRVWNLCWAEFQREWVMLSVCGLIFLGMIFAGSLIANVISSVVLKIAGISADGMGSSQPLVSVGISVLISQVVATVVNIGVQGVALVGLYRVVMDVLLGRKADVGRMFSQLRKLPTYAVTQLIFFAVVTLPTLLYFAGLIAVGLLAAGVNLSDASSLRPSEVFSPTTLGVIGGVTALGMVGYLVFFIAVLLPFAFFVVPEIVVSDCGAIEAFRRSWRIGSGQRLRMLGYGFVSGLIMFLGAILCLLPLILAVPLGFSLMLGLFLAARNGLDLPPPDHS